MSCDCHDFENNILNTNQVLRIIKEAVERKQPLSLTRFSHAELTYLNWQNHQKLVNKMEKYREYNGADIPIEKLTTMLIESVKNTTITGFIPQAFAKYTTHPRDQNNGWYWYNLTKEFLHRENFMPESICSVWSTQEMVYKRRFWKLLSGRSIAIVGRRAKEAVDHFNNNGANVTEAIELDGINKVNEVKEYLTNKDWEIAIISAGIPATILTPQLANETGRVVIDFGHGLDRIIDGEKFDFAHLVQGWQEKKGKSTSETTDINKAQRWLKRRFNRKKKFK